MARLDCELSPYMLKDVKGLEKAAEREEMQAMKGSYGYVFKVTVQGVECVAKKLHSAFVSNVSLQERQSITDKFMKECIILSKLRHPNIVQFVGVHCGRNGDADLSLIMESIRCDLCDFLGEHPNIPLPLKLFILLDISYGLVYLHEHSPPIVHRDLTARNVLISDKCQAKIADLGVAKIVSIQQQLAESHTKTPGQMYFMPPEAMKEEAACTPKLDIFSFGHLTLYVVNQKFPIVDYHLDQTEAMKKSGTIERARRDKPLKAVGSSHCLYSIITECLYDKPDQRLTTRDLNRKLSHLSAKYPVPLKDVLPLMGSDTAPTQSVYEQIDLLREERDMFRNMLQEDMNRASKYEQQHKAVLNHLDEENHDLKTSIGSLKEKLTLFEAEKHSMQETIVCLKDEKSKNEEIICDLHAKLYEATQEKEQLMVKLHAVEKGHHSLSFQALSSHSKPPGQEESFIDDYSTEGSDVNETVTTKCLSQVVFTPIPLEDRLGNITQPGNQFLLMDSRPDYPDGAVCKLEEVSYLLV